MNLMVTTNQKSMTHSQKVKIKGPNHDTKESHYITRELRREEKNREELQEQPEKKIKKMVIGIYVSMITLM